MLNLFPLIHYITQNGTCKKAFDVKIHYYDDFITLNLD